MRPNIGLALGAGSARGLAHLGVLKAFEEEGLAIDYLGGTSIGSVVGGFFAAGLDLHMLERLAEQLTWDHLTDLTVPRKGLVAGKKAKEFFELLTQKKTFSQLELPFITVAVDIEHGEEVVIDSGLVADGMRASMSIPGVYVPYQLDGKKLVDGAVLNRVPVTPVRDLGADIVIGVDVSHKVNYQSEVSTIFDVIMNSIDIMQQEITKHKNHGADLLIKPQVGHVKSTDLDQAGECIDLGYQETKKAIPKIKNLIEEWTGNEEEGIDRK
ncbi:patatin-like phospholipase family protein [Natroniella sulfidigena]|uniref:patatin-like phospholipase family protein n=1 Tax=Natroniella sulfidigena TaxID=723921 RepID=UPI002009F376|nr:patatin-like phospholipase family protein [Natroniella sulfidigena]MCK8816940.1 patatin-like phospholipase family protein [Natroniella sulfidigena]